MATPDAAVYETIAERGGYDPPPVPLGDLPEPYLRRAFAFGDGADRFAAGLAAGEPAVALVGVSTTGPPHVGTLGQVRAARRLQAAGVEVEFVVADLAACNAAGRDLATVRALADRYVAFVEALGFDEDRGRVRTQSGARDVLLTAQLLSRYYDPDAAGAGDPGPTAFERDLEAAYGAADPVGEETTAFAGDQVSLLLVADAAHPVLSLGYEHVLFVGGADNHGLAAFYNRVLAETPYDVRTAGLYTKLVGGLEGYPKMSKSIPASTLSLSASPERIREVVCERAEAYDAPGESLVFQILRLASDRDPAELPAVAAACAAGGEEWAATKREFADHLVEVAETWRATA